MIQLIDSHLSPAALQEQAKPNSTSSPSSGDAFEHLMSAIADSLTKMGLNQKNVSVTPDTEARQIVVACQESVAARPGPVAATVAANMPAAAPQARAASSAAVPDPVAAIPAASAPTAAPQAQAPAVSTPVASVPTAASKAHAVSSFALPDPAAAIAYANSITQEGYNAAQYADATTAQSLADLFGGKVTYSTSVGPIGPPAQAQISWGDGQEMCAGLLAKQISDAKQSGMSEISLETEIATEMASIGVKPSAGVLPLAYT